MKTKRSSFKGLAYLSIFVVVSIGASILFAEALEFVSEMAAQIPEISPREMAMRLK